MDEVEGALEIHVDHEIPLLLSHTHHQPVTGDPCVVDEDIDSTEVCDDFFYELVCCFEVSGIRSIGLGLYSESLELLNELLY